MNILKTILNKIIGFFVKTQTTPAIIQKEKGNENSISWLDLAQSQLGVSENNNPQKVIEYLKSTTLPKELLDPSTPWCSAFVTWCLEQSGMKSTKDAWAKSYLYYGLKTDAPKLGDIVIFSRGKNSGHVAFYIESGPVFVRVLGGNQGNQVSIENRPKALVLGYRKPIKK